MALSTVAFAPSESEEFGSIAFAPTESAGTGNAESVADRATKFRRAASHAAPATWPAATPAKRKSLPGSLVDTAETVIAVPRLVVPRKQRDAFLSMACELAEATRREAGCLVFDFADVGQDEKTGDDAFVLIEAFSSELAFKAHTMSSQFRNLAIPMMALSSNFEEAKGVRAAHVGGAPRGGFHVVAHADVPDGAAANLWLEETTARADELVAAGCLAVDVAKLDDEHFVVVETWPATAPGNASLLETLLRLGLQGRALSQDARATDFTTSTAITTAVYAGDDAIEGWA